MLSPSQKYLQHWDQKSEKVQVVRLPKIGDTDTIIYESPTLGYPQFFTKNNQDWLINTVQYERVELVNLETGQIFSKSRSKYAFRWTGGNLSPNGQIMAVDGCAPAYLPQILFFDISDLENGWTDIEIIGLNSDFDLQINEDFEGRWETTEDNRQIYVYSYLVNFDPVTQKYERDVEFGSEEWQNLRKRRINKCDYSIRMEYRPQQRVMEVIQILPSTDYSKKLEKEKKWAQKAKIFWQQVRDEHPIIQKFQKIFPNLKLRHNPNLISDHQPSTIPIGLAVNNKCIFWQDGVFSKEIWMECPVTEEQAIQYLTG